MINQAVSFIFGVNEKIGKVGHCPSGPLVFECSENRYKLGATLYITVY